MLPFNRFHTLRQSKSIRHLVQETHIRPEQLIQPVFIHEGILEPTPVLSMPGVFQHTLESVRTECNAIYQSGVRAILLFGIPFEKDALGSSASHEQGGVQRAIRLIKQEFPDLVIFADCCLCEYTDHGHCGVMTPGLDNDATLTQLQRIAQSYAMAGVDWIAPSGMMDGAIQAIRTALDTVGASSIGIMAYSAKYASALYGPFRDAAGSGDTFTGDRKHHQMSPTQRREAILETKADLSEGANIVMVKPGLFYMDIIRDIRNAIDAPIAAYQVSGEYSMLKLAASSGLADEATLFLESLIALRRAGADLIISYAAKDVLRFQAKK